MPRRQVAKTTWSIKTSDSARGDCCVFARPASISLFLPAPTGYWSSFSNRVTGKNDMKNNYSGLLELALKIIMCYESGEGAGGRHETVRGDDKTTADDFIGGDGARRG